jgi:UDP-glucose 4-epimerase
MKILITGCNGFLGKEMVDYFKDHEVLATDRTTLDPTCYKSVSTFFKKNKKIDIVIHTAVKGGKRLHKESVQDLYDNISMFDNLSRFSDKYGLLVNFGSGAEFGRGRSIRVFSEHEVKEVLPKDYYGLSKNLITRKINHFNKNIFNLRLFGCFGQHEEPQRLVRACYNNMIKDRASTIFQDKYMDYFYAQDVGRVIEVLPKWVKSTLPRDINLCYSEKVKLTDIAYKIKHLTSSDSDVIIDNTKPGNCYTGCNDRLESAFIELDGLEKGIAKCLKSWSKS